MRDMTKQDLLGIVEKIISLDSQMIFASIIDLKGNIVEGIMKTGKNSLESQRQEENFCKQVSQRRKMRKEFDRPLGKVRYVHVCLLYTSPSPRDQRGSRMPSSA